ncbi:flagellar export protein FliJ [Helicobacter sp. 11S03491-1]|uniref:flagellar export protein FliJ n=1 Tax=Helicobacter sp. 11S03491-1 TaxID=1476196 RepID=UPI000BA74EE3|nr:flagellar export protein FliJ [Helicobacter sp. 11S03491-1]PAF42634.1 hypothetical protein BKH45_03745 [Helicobacter sp. 11S03491-1]
MNTKFDALLRVKKQDLDKKESDIIKNNIFIASKYHELNETIQDLANINIPQNGDYVKFKRVYEMKKLAMGQIDLIQAEISELKNTGKKLQEFYKIASIEYEKIKYLQENEIKKQLYSLKKIEEKNLDEAGVVLFGFHKENV